MKVRDGNLTEKQMMVHFELCRHYRENGHVPLYRDLMVSMSMPNSTLSRVMRRLRELKYIQKVPGKNQYRILRWLEDDVRINVPLTGFLVKDKVVSSNRDPLAYFPLASAGVTCVGIDSDELFALKIIQPAKLLSKMSKANDVVIFRRRCFLSSGGTVLATLNGIQKLFKIKVTQKNILLLREDDVHLYLSPKDLFVIDGVKMSTFSNAEIEMI